MPATAIRAGRPDSPASPDFDLHGVDQNERKLSSVEGTLIPSLDLLVEVLAEIGDRRLLEFVTTQLFGDAFDFPGRHTVHNHLHQRQNQGLLASLVPLEQFGVECPITVSGHSPLEWTDPSDQITFVVSVSLAGPLVSSFVFAGAKVVGHLRFQHLVEHWSQ